MNNEKDKKDEKENERLKEFNRETEAGTKMVGLVMLVAIILFIIGVVIIGYRLYAISEDNRTVKTASTAFEDTVGVDNPNSTEPEEDDKNVYMDSDLIARLQEAFNNKDVIAYLSFPEAGINYPVVQGTDNSQYLHRNVYGGYSINGSIYLDSDNEKDFSSVSSVIYGHHMNNGSMFGSLERSLGNWKDKSFKIYTRKKVLTYKLCSTEVIDPSDRDFFIGKKSGAVDISSEIDSIDSSFPVEKEFIDPYKYSSKEFVSAFKKRYGSSRVEKNMKKFVTLITCHYSGGSTVRFGATGGLISSKNIVIKEGKID